MRRLTWLRHAVVAAIVPWLATGCAERSALAPGDPEAAISPLQEGPRLVDPNLEARTVVDGLITPTTMAFLGPDDFLVLEKNTGRVQRVVGGEVQATVLDLAVNFASERGLLGIALHPQFPVDPGVYLFWTESTMGDDTDVVSATPLLGNRVDRFVWDGETLTHAQNLIRIRAIQQDAGQPERGNHNGGVLTFGPDGKLYVFVGDVGRRGWLQNLPCGPVDRFDCPPGTPEPDDQFGGPEPTDAHLTGVVLRLEDDGGTPPDNPFFDAGAAIGGEAGANIQKIFSDGHRNGFGIAFDPVSGDLWVQENGDDAYAEINRVLPGMNSGWVQIMGPSSRVPDYRAIETRGPYFGLQQIRWPPTNLATTEAEALDRLFMLPGAHFADPVMSWRYVIEPGGIGFVEGGGLGAPHQGTLIAGGARDFLRFGHLFQFRLSADRTGFVFDDPRLDDGIADNLTKWNLHESESLLFGTRFGVVTDVRTGPNGNLFIVSLSHGAVYEITQRE